MSEGERTTSLLMKAAKEAGISEAIIEQLGNLGSTIAAGMFDFLHRFIDLAKTNPLWGAVLGVLVVDLMSHRVNWIHWTHEEQQWQNIDNQGNIITSAAFQFYDWFSGAKAGQKLVTVTVPGVISNTAALTILGLILSGWGIDAAGTILGDITKITNLTGSSQTAANLLTPSVTTLVEAGAPINIAIPSRGGKPAGVA